MVVIKPFGTRFNCLRPVTGTVLHDDMASIKAAE